jgi:DNA-binding transcriptional regulator YiaG
MAVHFRNVDASPDDDVTTWPYEALVSVIERGLVPDWQPVFAEIRRNPWGPVARRVAQITSVTDDVAVGQLFSLALARARAQAEADERAEVAQRVRSAIAASGLSAAAFAAQVGTSASRLSTYATGRVTPSAAMLIRIERHIPIPR